MNFNRACRVRSNVLPVDVTINGRNLPPHDALRADIHRAGCPAVRTCLDVVMSSECSVTVHVPAAYACAGAGVHRIELYDGCVAVCGMDLELGGSCSVEQATLKAAKPEHCT